MKNSARSVVLVSLTLLLSSGAGAGVLQQAGPQTGRAAASIQWTDDTGQLRKLSEFSGYPLVLLPIYTRCPMACGQNVAYLKKALADSKIDPNQFRVLLFSFDPSDTASVLTEYRRRESIPLGWFVGSADQAAVDTLLDSTGFQFRKVGSDFAHPNMLIFLDRKLRVSRWIYGTDYAQDFDHALQVALGRSDWMNAHGDVAYALLLFTAAILCVALFHQLDRRNSPRAITTPDASSTAG